MRSDQNKSTLFIITHDEVYEKTLIETSLAQQKIFGVNLFIQKNF